MRFVEVILENSGLKEAKLYPAALKASSNPDSGITIQNKSAYHVIKDCANITTKYLPHFVFGEYADPIKVLSGKFKKVDISNFVQEAGKNYVLQQLLIIVLDKIKKSGVVNLLSSQSSKTSPVVESSNPYGEYGLVTETVIEEVKDKSDLDILCEAFKVQA
jgi:hypothetical protein